MSEPPSTVATVLQMSDCDVGAIGRLLERFGITIDHLSPEAAIPGSYWGESEAGLIGDTLYVRPDTPVHSVLHEASHVVCMDDQRRTGLERDAGGDYEEENAVCYLQSLLADALPGFGRQRMWQDMDAWGYTFRLGSAQAWFEGDADESRLWLLTHGIIDSAQQLTWRRRDDRRSCVIT
jgi:hypothetical protein